MHIHTVALLRRLYPTYFIRYKVTNCSRKNEFIKTKILSYIKYIFELDATYTVYKEMCTALALFIEKSEIYNKQTKKKE
jgi:hypothetical protein